MTFLVVSRNHGTRLFPVTERDSLKGNVQPGTVVDTQLVAPLRYEFFLNSHAGIQVSFQSFGDAAYHQPVVCLQLVGN